jgi:hypothetical protein
MDTDTFVGVVKTEVHDSGVREVLEILERPPGRKPHERLVELSEWFRALPPLDRERVRWIVELAVHSGVFGLLAVLDGVRAIESGANKGSLELTYSRGAERQQLTSPSNDFLHDIYQALTYEQVFGGSAGKR